METKNRIIVLDYTDARVIIRDLERFEDGEDAFGRVCYEEGVRSEDAHYMTGVFTIESN